VLGLTLVTCGCAGMDSPRTIYPRQCDRSSPCIVVTTELSDEQRSELASTMEARVADRTLMGVAYDGEHLRLLPECLIEGRYAWRDAGLEQQLDSDSAAFVVEDPVALGGFVRESEPRSTSFRATRRVTLPARLSRKPRGPACSEVTHVVEGMIVGVAPEASDDAHELPVALTLDELPVEVRRRPDRKRYEKEPAAPEHVALGIGAFAALIVVGVITLLAETAEEF
jgi:hypothetical protein